MLHFLQRYLVIRYNKGTFASAEPCTFYVNRITLAPFTSYAGCFTTTFHKFPAFFASLKLCHPIWGPFNCFIFSLNPTKSFWGWKVLHSFKTSTPDPTLKKGPLCMHKECILCWRNCLNILCSRKI